MVLCFLSFLVCASAFSVNGIGEDRSIFSLPFSSIDRLTRLQFTLLPELSVLRQDGEYRSAFWTYRYEFYMGGPIAQWFVLDAGNTERFNQSFDLYYKEEELDLHVDAFGSVEEVYAGVGTRFGDAEIVFRGSYLYGTAKELWEYRVAGYSILDSFVYQHRGKIFSAGARYAFLGCSYEFLGDFTAERDDFDTLIDIPSRLTVALTPSVFDGQLGLIVEHSFWPEMFRSPTRFKLEFTKNRYGCAYFYNPWYLEDVTEHGIEVSFAVPIHALGTVTFDLYSSLRSGGSLQEVKISPRLVLTFDELFSQRR